MLRILGSKKVFCDGLTRRDLLHVGALAPLGLSLAGWSAAKAPDGSSTKDSFGKAKRCLLLYLWGSPSQLDTFDPKPDAPEEIRGTLRSIATSMNGVRVGEILPRIAKLLDRTTVLRSLTHPYPVHGMAFATSAVPNTDIPMESDPRDSRHWPFIGSVVDYLADRKSRKAPDIPRNFGLPFPFGRTVVSLSLRSSCVMDWPSSRKSAKGGRCQAFLESMTSISPALYLSSSERGAALSTRRRQ